MTTDSTMTDLERRATDAVIKLRQEWGTQEPRDSDVQLVRAALKAHAEWLAEQDWESVPALIAEVRRLRFVCEANRRALEDLGLRKFARLFADAVENTQAVLQFQEPAQ